MIVAKEFYISTEIASDIAWSEALGGGSYDIEHEILSILESEVLCIIGYK